VHKIGGDVTPPKLIYKVEPHYTDAARDAKIEGTVGLSVEIWEDGQAHNIRVVQALDSGLDQSAIDAITAWRFEPATRDGKKVRVQANVEVNFRLL
jgi:protein TonB